MANTKLINSTALPGYKTTLEAARYCKCSTDLLTNRRWKGLGPPFIKLDNGQVRYKVEDLDAWRAEKVAKFYERFGDVLEEKRAGFRVTDSNELTMGGE